MGFEGLKRLVHNWAVETELAYDLLDPIMLNDACNLGLKTWVTSMGLRISLCTGTLGRISLCKANLGPDKPVQSFLGPDKPVLSYPRVNKPLYNYPRPEKASVKLPLGPDKPM